MVDAKLVLEPGTTAFTNARVGGNHIDLGSWVTTGKQPFAGTPMFIKLYCTVAFSSDTETVQVDLITHATTAPTAADTLMTILMATAVDSISGLHAAGQLACIGMPSTGMARYLNVSFVIPTAVATGKMFAFLDYHGN